MYFQKKKLNLANLLKVNKEQPQSKIVMFRIFLCFQYSEELKEQNKKI